MAESGRADRPHNGQEIPLPLRDACWMAPRNYTIAAWRPCGSTVRFSYYMFWAPRTDERMTLATRGFKQAIVAKLHGQEYDRPPEEHARVAVCYRIYCTEELPH
eukprot:4146510-Pyramimonas_sp.AAC.1